MKSVHSALTVAVLAVAVLWASAPASAETYWSTFHDPRGVFTAEFPGTPASTRDDVKTDTSGTIPSVNYLVESETIAFLVFDSDFSALATQATAADVIDGGVTSIRNAAAQTLSDVTIIADGQTGREVTILDSDGNRITDRVFFVRHHLYQVMAVLGPKAGNDERAQAGRFLAGFHFTTQ